MVTKKVDVSPQFDASLFQFKPGWATDPAPPWLRDFFKGDILKKHAELQLEAQAKVLQIQADFLTQSLDMMRKSK